MSVHAQILDHWNLHKQSMTGVIGMSGTPDYYYEAVGTATWIEYKYVEKLPKVIVLTDLSKKYCLSALQQRWLHRATKNGTRNACVLGSAEGAIIFTDNRWAWGWSSDYLRERNLIVQPNEVAAFAAGFINHRVVEQHYQDAGVQYEHPCQELHHGQQTKTSKR